jgi:alpha-1,3-rhamnosyl/mannosyltransferase
VRVLVYAAGIHRGGGPYNHLRKFLTTLSVSDSRHDWTFILNSEFVVPDGISPEISVRQVTVRGALHRLYEDLWRQRRDARATGVDVLLNLADFGPLPRGVPVVTYQRNPNYFYPELLALQSGSKHLRWELRGRLARRMVRRSDRILCPSRTMADHVAATVSVAADRVHALHHPFDVSSTSHAWEPSSPARVLYVGHLMPHKNHLWLLETFAASDLARSGAQLWMTAARQDWPHGYDALVRTATDQGIRHAVRLLDRVPPEQLPELYRTSTLFAFASLGESFGFPLVEALASGMPTLALDTPIAKEICADAVRYLPSNVESAATVLRDAADSDASELERWGKLARARAEDFCLSWPQWLDRLEEELEAVNDERP